mgnify:CR=1 FL=1
MMIKKIWLALSTVLMMTLCAPAAHGAGWFDVMSDGGETISVSTDISSQDNGKSYLVWVRNSFITPQSREEYTRDRGYDKTVSYKLTLYKFNEDWKKFNIVQVAVYSEDGVPIDQYTNPDMDGTDNFIPPGSTIEAVAEVAKVIYEITNNPE